MEDKRITLDDIIDKYVRPSNPEQEKRLLDFLFDNHIEHTPLFSPKGTLFKVSPRVYNYLIQEGFGIELVEVRDIGSLSPEERRKVKEYTHSLLASKREETLKELRKKYGNL